MSTILQLKKRVGKSPYVKLARDAAKTFVDSQGSEQAEMADRLHEFIKATLDEEEFVHDKAWMEMIVNWVPAGDGQTRGRLAMSVMARWLTLIRRVDKLDDEREGPFTLSKTQADLIFKRLCDPLFEMVGISPAYAGFASEFFEAYGEWPEGSKEEDRYEEKGPEDAQP